MSEEQLNALLAYIDARIDEKIEEAFQSIKRSRLGLTIAASLMQYGS